MRWRLAAAALGAAGVMALTGCLFQVPAQTETLPYDQLTFTDTAGAAAPARSGTARRCEWELPGAFWSRDAAMSSHSIAAPVELERQTVGLLQGE